MSQGKAGFSSSVRVGKARAREALADRDRAKARRRRALRGLAAADSRGVLIAEGDSWFDYPFDDVLAELEDQFGFDVESVAHRGDTIEDMAYGKGQFEAFVRCLDRALRRGAQPVAVLLSGGGNDIAGDHFGMMLDNARAARAGLNDAVLEGVVDERLAEAYVVLVEAISETCRQRLGRAVPILVHGYAHPVPDGRGFLGGWGPLPGPWLEPGFRRKGYAELAERVRIARVLIDRFNAMLQRLAQRRGFEHVRHVDLRQTLSPGPDYKQWWADELHPTSKGFRAVARKFADSIPSRGAHRAQGEEA